MAGGLALAVWLLALLAMWFVVPWEDRRTRARIPEGISPYKSYFGPTYEMEGGEQRRIDP